MKCLLLVILAVDDAHHGKVEKVKHFRRIFLEVGQHILQEAEGVQLLEIDCWPSVSWAQLPKLTDKASLENDKSLVTV